VPQGLIWRLNGRLAAMRSSDAQGEAKEDEAPVVIAR
jgi:hypothetical protein